MRNYFTIYLLFFCCIQFHDVSGKSNPLPDFRNISINQGLSQNTVMNITQDQRGFMWFGTNDGINRYDGQHFKIYRFSHPDPLIVTDNYILSSGQDFLNNLWISTLHSIKQYDPLYDNFRDIFLKKDTSRIQCAARSLISDRKNQILAGTDHGLLRYDSSGKVFLPIPLYDGKKQVQDYSVRVLSSGKEHPVYAGIPGLGIAIYSANDNNLRLINKDLKEFNNLVRYGDSLYAGNNQGVYLFGITQDSLLYATKTSLLAGNITESLQPTKDGMIWIGTDGAGLWLYNPATGELQQIPSGTNEGEINSKAICTIFLDKEENTWIGTMFGGVEYAPAKKNGFTTRQCLQGGSSPANFVNCFAEDRSGKIWIGTDGGGVFCYNPALDEFCNSKILREINRNSGQAITCMGLDSSDNLWIGSYGKGVACANLNNGHIRTYTTKNSSLTTDFIWNSLITSDGKIWIGAMTHAGLFLWNEEKKDFDKNILKGQNIYSLAEAPNGDLLAGTQNALFRISAGDNQIEKHLIGAGVRSVLCAESKLWIGTEGRGLLLYDSVVQNFLSPFRPNSISVNNNILSLRQDSAGYLWAGTFNGLFRIEPETGQFIRFDVYDGLQSNQFNYFDPLATRQGCFYFGGINGFTFFHPRQIITSHEFTPLYITNFKGFANDSSGYPECIPDTLKISFPYEKQGFLLEFTTPDFNAARKIKYAYRFEGRDSCWNEIGEQQQIIFPRLREGNYRLHLRNSDRFGNWNPQDKIVILNILPPFYRTTWAWLCYIILTIFILFFAYRQKRKQDKARNALTIAGIKLEQQKELTELKEHFFVNISHELRTPLTLILTPLKELLTRERDRLSEKEELIPVYNNALILWQRVNQLLLFRKAEKPEQLTCSAGNPAEFIRKHCKVFEQLADYQGVSFSFPKENTCQHVLFDKEKVGIIIDNLLSNAFKFTPRGGTIIVEISKEEECIKLIVKDSGCGIPVELKKQIFERHYSYQSHSGIGIGLALVRQYTEMHGGSVTVDSEQGNGSCFIVRLPLEGTDEQVMEQEEENDFCFLTMAESFIYKESSQHTGTDNSGRPVILVVEDHDDLRQFIVRLISRHSGYTIYESAGGNDAWDKIQMVMPDLIISDIMMPGLSGMELCQRIKSDLSTSHIYIILITADLSEQTEVSSREYGADDFLTKPFDSTQLFVILKNALYTRQRLRAYFRKQLTGQPSDEPSQVNKEELFVKRCIAVIRECGLEEDFSVTRLAEETGMSASALYKKIKNCTGQTVNELIRSVRLAVAAEMLLEDENVSEVAYKTGFSDQKYFREIFKKQFGILPSSYKKSKETGFPPLKSDFPPPSNQG